MVTKEFSVGRMIKIGWEAMKSHFWFFVLALIVGVGITGGSWLGYQWSYDNEQHPAIIALIWLLAFVLSSLVHLGFVNISLRLADQKKVSLLHLFSIFPEVFKFIIGNILYSLMLVVGLALFVIPGLYWGVKYCLFPFFIIDRKVGPIEALKLSAEATDGAKWDILAFWIVSVLLSWLGLLCLIIGLFAALPTIWVASAAIYRRLTSST